MATYLFKENEKLIGASNYAAWKLRLDTNLDGEYVLEYVQGGVPQPPENSPTAAKERYKKGESKPAKLFIDSLKDHILIYISKLKTYKELYDNIIGMFEVQNLNHFLDLKKQLKDIKSNKG